MSKEVLGSWDRDKPKGHCEKRRWVFLPCMAINVQQRAAKKGACLLGGCVE